MVSKQTVKCHFKLSIIHSNFQMSFNTQFKDAKDLQKNDTETGQKKISLGQAADQERNWNKAVALLYILPAVNKLLMRREVTKHLSLAR